MPFFTIYAADVKSKWHGQSEKLIQGIYDLAAAVAPSIIFIDEADEIFTNKSDEDKKGASGITTQILTALENAEGVFTIAATNYPWKLDPAFRRRLENKIYIGLPKIKDIENILHKELEKRHHSLQKFDVEFVARKLDGYSCHDVTMVVKEAQALAFRRLQDTKYFRISDVQENLGPQFVACRNTDPGACQLNIRFLEKKNYNYKFLKIDMIDMEMAVNNRKSTVDKFETKGIEEFYRKFAVKA